MSVSGSIYKGSDEVPITECDICQSQNVTSYAEWYCPICDEFLCPRCERSHKGSRATRDHILVSENNIPFASLRITDSKHNLPIMLCDQHKTMTLDTYCKTHDDVICTMCKMSNHKKCDTADVRRHRSKMKVKVGANILRYTKNLSDLELRLHFLKKARLDEKSSVKKQISKCLQELQQIRKDINDKFDAIEKKASVELHDIENEICKEIDDHVFIAEDVLRHVEEQGKVFTECQDTQDDDVIFVGLTKGLSRVREYSDIISSIETDVHPTDIRLHPSDVIADMVLYLESLATAFQDKQPTRHTPSHLLNNRSVISYVRPNIHTDQTSIENMFVVDKQEIDVGSRKVYGCTFMADGNLVIGCADSGLKMFDRYFRFNGRIPDYSLDVAAVDDNDTIVTRGRNKQIQLTQALPNVAAITTMNMDRQCFGVAVFCNEIYVTCHNDPGNGEVQVLDMDYTLQRRLGVSRGRFMFTAPDHVKVSKDGRKIFVSDWDTGIVTCLTQQGHVIYEYSDRDLKSPAGMYVDEDDNLLVCGVDSNNVHVVGPNGRKLRILLSSKDGIQNPVCIAYRPSDGCLVVGLHEKSKVDKKLHVFRMNQKSVMNNDTNTDERRSSFSISLCSSNSSDDALFRLY